MDPEFEDAGADPASGGEPPSHEDTGDAEGRGEDQDTGGADRGDDPDAVGSDAQAGEDGEDGEEGRDADDGEGEAEGEGEGEDGEQRLSKRQRARQRKKEKIRQKDDYIRELEAENTAIRQKLDRTSRTGEELKKPNPDDYEHGDNDPEYGADLSVYKLKKAEMEANTEELQNQSKATTEKIAKAREESWAQARSEGRSRYNDFDDVVGQLSEETMTPEMAVTIADSDVAADLAYHLGKSPDLARRISRMSPLQQARALGGIEARLSAQTRGRKPADPPDPMKTVGGKAARREVRTPYNARSVDEYVELRRKEEEKRHPPPQQRTGA